MELLKDMPISSILDAFTIVNPGYSTDFVELFFVELILYRCIQVLKKQLTVTGQISGHADLTCNSIYF